MCRHICKEEKNEFIGQVIRVFETFLEERNIMSPGESNGSEIESTAKIDGDNYDCIKNNLEMLFYNWKLLEDDRPLIEYLFEVSLNGVKCGGTISVKAVDDTDAYQKAQDKIADGLYKAFPDLDIEYDVLQVEEEGYPKYEVFAQKYHFDSAGCVWEFTDQEKAVDAFENVVKQDYYSAELKIKTCKNAKWCQMKKNTNLENNSMGNYQS